MGQPVGYEFRSDGFNEFFIGLGKLRNDVAKHKQYSTAVYAFLLCRTRDALRRKRALLGKRMRDKDFVYSLSARTYLAGIATPAECYI